MKATKSVLAVAALAAGTLVLTGCDPASTTGGTGASGSGGITCDPNGFGPLSGCDGAGDSTQKPAQTTPAPAQTTPKPAQTTPVPTRIDTAIQSSDSGFTVTVTWIVVSIDFTGFRECVIGLRSAPENPDDHFGHRLTTAKDCEAQQVDTVYRPVSE